MRNRLAITCNERKLMKEKRISVVLCTFPDFLSAQQAAHDLVSRSFAACVNILPGVRSIYAWKGELQSDDEVLMVVKTAQERLSELIESLVSLHPYELPEVIALPVTEGHHPYLEWIATETAAPPPS